MAVFAPMLHIMGAVGNYVTILVCILVKLKLDIPDR